MTAILKDGTSVTGQLVGKVEIEDGLIRRRYDGADIERVDFDNYIGVEGEKTYHSCPIRLTLPAAATLFFDPAVGSTALTGAVTCNDLKIVNVAFSRSGNLRSGKAGSVSARFTVAVPEGADQLAELSIELLQNELAVATARKRLTIDEGELSVIPLKLNIPAQRLVAESEPVFRIQLVTQDATREVERGGFFWWFTIPLPL